MAPLRVFLAGRMYIENGEKAVDQQSFPGRQGRLAFAYLVSERGRPVSHLVGRRAFRDMDVTDKMLRALADRVQLVPWRSPTRPSPIASITTVKLKGGRELKAMVSDFRGTPDNPLDHEELREKFLLLTRDHDREAMTGLFERLHRLAPGDLAGEADDGGEGDLLRDVADGGDDRVALTRPCLVWNGATCSAVACGGIPDHRNGSSSSPGPHAGRSPSSA